MLRVTLSSIVALTLAAAVPGFVVDDPASSTDATVADLGWLTGHWSGQALGGFSEETWSTPAAGTMVGMFRLVTEEREPVLEFIVIEDTEAGPVYRFQHFDPDYRSWEKAPLTYSLVEHDEGFVAFESEDQQPGKPRRISYELAGEGELEVLVEGWDTEGEPMELLLQKGQLKLR